MASRGDDILDFIIALLDVLDAAAKGIKKMSKIVSKKTTKLKKAKPT